MSQLIQSLIFLFEKIMLMLGKIENIPNNSVHKESTCNVGHRGDMGSVPGQEDPLKSNKRAPAAMHLLL